MPSRVRRRRRVQPVGIALVLLIATAATAGAAPASVKDKQAQAAKLQDQLERQGNQVSVLAEKYNRARLKVTELEAAMGTVEADVTRSDQRLADMKDRVSDVAVDAYVHGGSNSVLNSLARSGEGTDLVVRREYMRVAVADQRDTIGELRSVMEDLGESRSRLSDERERARAAATKAKKLQAEAAKAEGELNQVLKKVNGEVATLVSAEQARREAAEAARRRAAAAPRATAAPAPGSKGPTLNPVAPAPTESVPASGRGAVAVAEARKHLGKPYRYGGSGPDNFDCSGLTSWAWRAAGVNMSHSAYAQWFETTRVPISQVAPGDLLFFGPSVSGIHHNAIYIGGGQMIEASRTGTPIRIREWRSADLVGAGRPG